MANLRANKIYGTSGPDANGSALFNGTDYLTAANAAAFRLNQGSGADFTIEAWIYAKSVGTQFTVASVYHTSGNKRSYMLYVSSDGDLKLNYSSSGTAGSTSALNAGTIPTNEWIHVAVTHDTSATTVRLFKNGLMKTSDTSAHATWYANTDGDFEVGKNLDGFISNLHINKGTCKYTASFDPYKQPIEVETNTSVLCCNSSINALNDDKSNTFVQTASDGVKPTSDMPFSRSDGGVVFDGEIKMNSQGHMYFPTGDTSQRGRGRGLIMGGATGSPSTNTDIIKYFDVASQGITETFGNLTDPDGNGRRSLASVSSSTRACTGGGYSHGGSPGTVKNIIDYVTIATTANALDFGDMQSTAYAYGAASNQTRGLFAGGYQPNNSAVVNTIDLITIATTGNASNFGDLSRQVRALGGLESTTRGVFFGGTYPAVQDTIDYITFSTTGDATDFGNLTDARDNVKGSSSSTRGVMGGGRDPSNSDIIDYITIASTGDATDFGDLLSAKFYYAATGNSTRTVWAGDDSASNVMEFVTIATTGNAVDFGDQNGTPQQYNGCASDSHGGLS